jgi:hypothetical protein
MNVGYRLNHFNSGRSFFYVFISLIYFVFLYGIKANAKISYNLTLLDRVLGIELDCNCDDSPKNIGGGQVTTCR